MEEGRQRRSARISALDKCKQEKAPCGGVLKLEKRAEDGKETGSGQRLPGKKRGRKKKKLHEVEEVVVNSVDKAITEAGQNLQQDGHLCSADKSSSNAGHMPEKQVLELILDVLQRKDTHEIFAEPVDPEEVEGYYDIIKDPMDFATMRAKLQEGLYTSLEQFENDVFLICSNAMLFNSPSTVFFRQARSIQELAKKAFLAVRTDPENFETEFSSTRRRHYLNKATKTNVNAISQSDAGNSDSHAKPATGAKSNNLTTNIASNDRQKSLPGHFGPKRNLHERSVASGSTALVENLRTGEDHFGFRDGIRSGIVEEERRFTHRPWTSFLSSNESLISTLATGPKQVSYANMDNNSYTASLQRFVEDLGPTAQMVAERKLQKLQNLGRNFQPGQNSQTQAAPSETPGQNFQTPAKPPVQLTSLPFNDGVNFPASRINIDHILFHPNARVDTADWNDKLSTSTGVALRQSQGSDIPSCSYSHSYLRNSVVPAACNPDSNNGYLATIPDAGLPGNLTQSGDSTSEFSQLRLLETMLRNPNSMVTPPSRPFQVMKASGSSQTARSMHNSVFPTSDEENQAAVLHSWPFQSMKASGSGQAANSMRNTFPTTDEDNHAVVSHYLPFQSMKASGSGQAAHSTRNYNFPTSDEENQGVASHHWPFQSTKASSSSQAANSVHNSGLPTSDVESHAAVSHYWPLQTIKASTSGQAANSMHNSGFPPPDEENQAPSWNFQAMKVSGSGKTANSMNKSHFQISDEENRAAASPSWPFQAMKAAGSGQAANSMNISTFHTSDEENQGAPLQSWPFQAIKTSGLGQATNPMHMFGSHTSSEENRAAALSSWPFQAMKTSGSGQTENSMHIPPFHTSNGENHGVASSSWPFQDKKASSASQAANSMHNPCLHIFDGENQVAVETQPDLNHRLDSAQIGQYSSWGQPESWGPQTVLDMSYLQARLGEMNPLGQNGISRPELPPAHVSETVFVNDSERNVGHSGQGELSTRPLFDSHPDLALQL